MQDNKTIIKCERCGMLYPPVKMVSDREWKFICCATYPLDCVLCEDCMDFIKKMRIKWRKEYE